jgi:hypothetical protein
VAHDRAGVRRPGTGDHRDQFVDLSVDVVTVTVPQVMSSYEAADVCVTEAELAQYLPRHRVLRRDAQSLPYDLFEPIHGPIVARRARSPLRPCG